jgi:hypothetical protein
MDSHKWLDEKRNNFKLFVEKILPTDNGLRKQLQLLASLSHELLITVIRSELIPHKKDLMAYIRAKALEHHVPIEKIDAMDLDKLKRYLELFIDYVEQA